MGIKDTIKRLLDEAELYKKQGLLNEAGDKYSEAYDIIAGDDRIKNKEKLLDGIARKKDRLNMRVEKVQQGPSHPELSEKAQDLIQRLFSFSREESPEEALLEGAIALAKFGQMERALVEFEKLIQKDSHRVVAAKNIIRCHIQTDEEDKAVDKFEEWIKDDDFPRNQLSNVRLLFVDMLKNKGIDRKLTEVETEPEMTKEPEEQEEVIDISAVGIYISEGPSKGKVVELDVNFQSANLLSIIVPKNDASVIEHLTEGQTLNDLQFFSPIAIFNGTGEVAAKSQIKSGPKQGDYCLDIKITSR